MYYLQECIFFDQQIGNKICKIISLYRSPNQTASEFDKCLTFLNLPLKSITQINLFLQVVVSGFNLPNLIVDLGVNPFLQLSTPNNLCKI